MRRRGQSSIAANPVLIGAATTLVIVVAVFLAYNANSGLPFVPTYNVTVEVPNASALVRGNDVRLGGTRVGVVQSIVPVNGPGGRVRAKLSLKLETTIKPLPVDSTFLIRSRSALGLKYLEITKGESARGFPEGAAIPVSSARPEPVELDEVLGTFDDKTRLAQRAGLKEIGDAFTGRGQSLNAALGELVPLLNVLEPVTRNLADDRTRLSSFGRSLESFASQVAPVADVQGSLIKNLDTTFTALAAVTGPIQDTIQEGPPLDDAFIEELPKQRPFLANSERLFAALRPGTKALGEAAPDLADALQVGQGTLRQSKVLNSRLTPTFKTLQEFAEDPLVSNGVTALKRTGQILDPTLAFVTPAQTVCNYFSLFARNGASILSDGDENGTAQNFVIVAPLNAKNSEGGPSTGPANGPGPLNYLHANPFPNTAAPGQTRECEAGNEPYLAGRMVTTNPAGNQGVKTEKTTRDKAPGIAETDGDADAG